MYHRLLFSIGNIIASLILGAIAMVMFGLYFEETFKLILNAAEGLKSWLLRLPLSTKYHNFVRLFLHESTFVFAFFTIVMRIIGTAVYALFLRAIGSRSEAYRDF